jgi:GrpB-like predicted nucleotidyltransferase (UPF0157 family)
MSDLHRKSRPVIIGDYDPRWGREFARIAEHVRAHVGSAAARIDHIGSTAVPGLGAKDVIDVQITVADLDRLDGVIPPLRLAGYRQGEEFVYDDFHTMGAKDPELRKKYMRERAGERRIHIHVREDGRFNQRYALLFRDYLRASEPVRREYELMKRRAARVFPDSIDGYLYLKDPVFHIIYEAASLWARGVGWAPGDDFL